MKKTFLVGAALLLMSFKGQAADNFLGPNGRVCFVPVLGEGGGLSFLGEFGAKNVRVNTTYGTYFTPCSRLKISVEALTQRYRAHLPKQVWVWQCAGGAEYQYILRRRSILRSIEGGGGYSHAFGRHLNSFRKLAGSNGGFAWFGSTLQLWRCAYLSAAADYDYVAYHHAFPYKRLANGWGGGFDFTQYFPRSLSLNLCAEWRRPFNFYGAKFDWEKLYKTWGLNLGVYGNYTSGKNGAPNVSIVGFQIGALWGGEHKPCCRPSSSPALTSLPLLSESKENEQGEQPSIPIQEEPPVQLSDPHKRMFCNLADWLRSAAIYMPEVLVANASSKSLSSQGSTPSPEPPVCMTEGCVTGCEIPDAFFNGDSLLNAEAPLAPPIPPIIVVHVNYPIASYFQSTDTLTYSATGLPGGISIDPITGVISGSQTGPAPQTNTYPVTVTGTATCGAVSESFNLILSFNG